MLNKKLIASAIFALALMVVSNTAFAAATLKAGSKGEDVKTLQTALKLTADGSFGPMTKAAVIAFQTNNKLVADGIVGPKTWAAITGGTAAVVTGDLCPNGMTLASNCSTGPTTAVALCPNGMTLASNCASLPATGTTTGTLSGGAGDINLDKTSTSVESNIVEGRSNTKVLGFKVEAVDSDAKISNIKVSLVNASGHGSTRIDRYLDGVSVYMGSTKVGSADISDFSKNGTTYSKSIALTNTIVKMGSSNKATFYVTADAISNIDSTDALATVEWDITADNVRFQDATGVILTNNQSVTENFGVETSTQNDTVTLLSSSNNPAASNLKVKDNTTSDEYLVAAFKIKADADSSDLNIVSIPVVATTGEDANISDIINDIYLKVGSTVYDNYDVTGSTYTFNFDDGEFVINSGDTTEAKLYVKFNEEGASTYTAGETVKFTVNGPTMVVENTNGDSVDSPSNQISGSTHTLQLQGVNFALTSVDAGSYSETAGINPSRTITMALKVTTDETLYILKDATASDIGLDVTGGSGSPSVSFVSGTGTPTIVSDGSDDYYEISDTGTLYIRAIVNGDINGTVQDVTAQLTTVNAALSAGGDTTEYTLAPASSFDANTTLRY